ncbi:MAG: hypothetical protein OEW57_14635 [Gammaproteobacteria bacterium]|nr:hypothetical protein [Gammaproteobacteria bacterium]
MRALNIVRFLAVALLASAPWSVPGAGAADGPPSYQLQFLGAGSPVAVNNSNVVVGSRLGSGSNYQPLVSVGGAPWTLLPVPAGAMSTFPTDINDSGVIVGVSFSTQWAASAVRWKNPGSGYVVEVLPRLPGDATSYATNINNLGQIVGARNALGYVPTGTGWLYSDAGGFVDLYAQYGWVVAPSALNDNGQVIGGAERLDLATGLVEWIGDGPTNYNAVSGVAINNGGMIAGAASLRSTSLNIVSVFRYEGAAGWRFIAGSSRYTVASSINALGDVGYGELGAGLYLDGLGTYAVNDLLTSATVQAGWAVTGNGVEVNDLRALAALGRNSITGESGGVLLTPVGTQQAPTAPANLVGVAHPSTTSEPYNSINLTWQNTSPLTRGYELQRSVASAATWTSLALTPPGTATSHTDTTVGAGITYDYRVRATGIGGASPWSAIATVTAPAPVKSLQVANIVLSAKAAGSKVTVTGDVTVRDGSGAAVANASVAVRWTLPNGSTKVATAATGSTGHAIAKVSGGRGTYTLTVTDVGKTGYVFDAGASVLSKSITR